MRTFIASALMLMALAVSAKSYPFKFQEERNVCVTRSAAAGTKMVEVVAYGGSASKAIDKAMVDAVAALTFTGAAGRGEMEGCPAVLIDGAAAYEGHKKSLDKFFKKGEFLSFVKRVNSGFPTGTDNVKTPKGRRVRVVLIVDWKALAEHFKAEGYKTAVSELSNY